MQLSVSTFTFSYVPSTIHDLIIAFSLDVGHKTTAVAWEGLSDPECGHSSELTKTVFGRAMNTNLPFWDFLALPEQQHRHHIFGFLMQGAAALQPPNMIFKALDWSSVSSTAKIVDVGGGIGTATMPLIEKYPDLTVIVQDLPHVVEEGRKFWMTKNPAALTSGRAKFEAHDLLNPQPIKDASIFIVKQVLHNWPDKYNAQILRNLREAATPSTTLVMIDYVLPYACRQPADGVLGQIEGDVNDIAPEPLLPNYGPLSESAYGFDFMMMLYFNAQEHTLLQFKELLASAGWDVKKCNAIDVKIESYSIQPFMYSCNRTTSGCTVITITFLNVAVIIGTGSLRTTGSPPVSVLVPIPVPVPPVPVHPNPKLF
ncbi:hypothetical protein D9758_011239 [Tetrapyrgos nigripes]|uniref:O-methyltransferase C-terminal domain-containing protein n=1 Tax=Tetrapyrgos nigripes TaxID=182062 RepID=A0A8H5D6P7_9AGAR|nr:hypothetical protein D9758_011239 [Tetrapyrgos nigripes]